MLPLMALFDVGMKVLDKFIPDPEAKAKAQKELLQMQQEGIIYLTDGKLILVAILGYLKIYVLCLWLLFLLVIFFLQ
jgi:hypothetical protein